MDHSDTLFATLDTIKQVKDRAGYWLQLATLASIITLLVLAVPYVVGVWG